LPVEIGLFADDAKLVNRISNVADQACLNEALRKIYNWSLKWKMNFNTNKCYVMTMKNGSNILEFNYMLGSKILDRVTKFTDLGVTVNSSLTWSDHIAIVKSKAMRNLGLIKRTLGDHAKLETKKLLYVTLVRSCVSYATQVWCPTNKRDIISLESIQRQATKYFLGYNNDTYVLRLNKTNLLPLTYIREMHDLILFYNMVHGRLSINLDRYFLTNKNNRRGRSVLDGIDFIAKRYHTVKGSCFYTNRVLNIWKMLPLNIRQIIPPVNAKRKPQVFVNAVSTYYRELLNVNFDINNVCSWITVCNCATCRLR
jgi:hypothetical protein